VEVASADDIAALEQIAQAGGGDAEDWTAMREPRTAFG
jgi:hypothetical protein